MDPKDPNLLLGLGTLLHEASLTDYATDCFLKVADNFKDYRAFHNLGLEIYSNGNLNGGIRFSEHVLSLKPDHLPSFRNLIYANLYKGALKTAKMYANKALKYWPDNKELKSLKRKIKRKQRLPKILHLKPINIIRKMKKVIEWEHGNREDSSTAYSPYGKPETSKNSHDRPPLRVRKSPWKYRND